MILIEFRNSFAINIFSSSYRPFTMLAITRLFDESAILKRLCLFAKCSLTLCWSQANY